MAQCSAKWGGPSIPARHVRSQGRRACDLPGEHLAGAVASLPVLSDEGRPHLGQQPGGNLVALLSDRLAVPALAGEDQQCVPVWQCRGEGVTAWGQVWALL